jgi:hypothetical protein
MSVTINSTESCQSWIQYVWITGFVVIWSILINSSLFADCNARDSVLEKLSGLKDDKVDSKEWTELREIMTRVEMKLDTVISNNVLAYAQVHKLI